jgi:hypothetical protein
MHHTSDVWLASLDLSLSISSQQILQRARTKDKHRKEDQASKYGVYSHESHLQAECCISDRLLERRG